MAYNVHNVQAGDIIQAELDNEQDLQIKRNAEDITDIGINVLELQEDIQEQIDQLTAADSSLEEELMLAINNEATSRTEKDDELALAVLAEAETRKTSDEAEAAEREKLGLVVVDGKLSVQLKSDGVV